MNISRLLCWTVPIFLWNGFRLLLFVVSLTPGFFRFAWYYAVSADRVSVRYGQESIRQTLDVYRSAKRVPDEAGEHKCLLTGVNSPVLVFYTGGGWIIGYKMWGSLLARALTAAGIVVVIPDLRNYPWAGATVRDMVNDVDTSLEWTIKNIEQFGGDPSKIVVVGQSAGGHVAFMALLQKSRASLPSAPQDTIQSTQHQYRPTTWMPSSLKGFVSISSPFRLEAMQESFVKKGLDDQLVDRIFGHENEKYDPFLVIQEFRNTYQSERLFQELPPIQIYHGTKDQTVPHETAEAFYEELRKHVTDEDRLSFISYSGWSHTDPILESPMEGDQTLHRDLFHDVVKWTDSNDLTWPEHDPIISDPLCPQFMVDAGRFFNPF